MARFCMQCGTPAANETVKFCSKCGAPLMAAAQQPQPAAPGAQPPSPPAAQPAPPPASAPAAVAAPVAAGASKGMSTVAKIILGVVSLFVVMGVLALGTCVFLVHKAKQKVEQAKAEYGMGENGPAATARDVCSLISKEEVSAITGATVTDAQGTESKCTYSSATSPVVLETDVAWSGGKFGLKLGVAALRHMGPVDTVKTLDGIGEEAYTIALPEGTREDMQKEAEKDQSGMVKGMTHVMAESPLMFRKGDVMVTVRLMEATDPETAKQSIAKIMASRL